MIDVIIMQGRFSQGVIDVVHLGQYEETHESSVFLLSWDEDS